MQIYFYTKSGGMFTKFDCKKFLYADKKRVEIEGLEIACLNLFSNIFVVLVDKYILTAVIKFDDHLQRFQLKLIYKEEPASQLYFGTLYNARFETGDKVYQLDNGRIILKKPEHVISVDDYFDSKAVVKLNDNVTVINNFQFKMYQMRRRSSHMDPFFLLNLLEMNLPGTVCQLICAYVKLFPEEPSTAPFFVEHSSMQLWINQEHTSDFNLQKIISNSLEQIEKMTEYCQGEIFGQNERNRTVFMEILAYLQDIYNNKRGQDPFACLFIIQTKIFALAEKKLAGPSQRSCLRSKEVIWALHSQQPDALLDACFPVSGGSPGQGLSWENMKKFCVPIWYDDGSKLKAMVEKLALIQYKQTKYPHTSS
jgi:hypothetical protein